MTALPTGWTMTPIGDVLAPLEDGRTLHQGWSPRCDSEPSEADDVWAVLKTTAVQAGHFLPEHNKRLPSHLSPRPLLAVREGDLLITCAGPRNRCGVACLIANTRPKLMISGKMYRMRFDDQQTDARYIAAYLQSTDAHLAIDRMKTGGSDSGLNLTMDRFRRLPLPLAPLDEQRRIVDAIEQQFSRLDDADEALRRVGPSLNAHRVATLRSVFLQEWPERELQEVAHAQLGKMLSEKSKKGVNPKPYLRNKNVRWEHVDVSDVAEMDFTEQEVEKFRLKAGDVLICEGGAGVGRTGIWRDELEVCCYQKALHRVRPGSDLLPEFLVHFMRYLVESRRLDQHLSGVAIGHFPQEDLRTLKLPLPPVDLQAELVARLDRQSSVSASLERGLESALRKSQALRRVVLREAFAGRLATVGVRDESSPADLMDRSTERAASAGSTRRMKDETVDV